MLDVVIVGARCAGAALATFLARAGAKVLVVDRAPLHTDQVLSTHTIHPPGVDVLDELGVGAAVRTACPTSRVFRLRKGDAFADLRLGDGRVECCPRRYRLDGLLQDAAIEAGADVRERSHLTEVRFEGGRAVGVRIEHAGTVESMDARLVVGADGRRSEVAARVGAEEYLAYDAPRAMYWGYWEAPSRWHDDRFPFDLYVGHVGDDIRAVFQTEDDQILVGSLPPVAVARSWRHEPEAALRRNLADGPVTGPLLAGAEPAGRIRGTLQERYFFRRAAGPGWVLVGDAGHHKEFVVGDGITEALLQARSLARAILEDDDAALVRWWRERDVDALPGYFWGRDEGALGAPSQLETSVVARIAHDPRAARSLTRLPEHQCSPYDAVPMRTVVSALGRALLRGRLGVMRDFVTQARRVAEYQRTLAERRRLLAEVAPASSP